MRPRLPDNLEKNLVSVLLAVLVPTMLAAALCRHLLPDLHAHVLKFAAGCLAWLASLGMARAATLGLHVRVSVLADAASDAARRRLATAADFVFLLFALFSYALGAIAFVGSLVREIPGHPLIHAAIPVGSALTAYRLVQNRRARGKAS